MAVMNGKLWGCTKSHRAVHRKWEICVICGLCPNEAVESVHLREEMGGGSSSHVTPAVSMCDPAETRN